MKKENIIMVIGALATSMLLSACGGSASTSTTSSDTGSSSSTQSASGTYNWSLPLSVSENSVIYSTAQKFAELLNEKSSGSINLTLYPNGQMGSDAEICENVQTGSVAFMYNMPSTIVSYVPEAAIFDYHGAFQNSEQGREAVDGEFGTKIDELYQQHGFKILGFGDYGMAQLTSSREINSLADLAGLKIRVIENPHQIAFWEGMGASPTPMAWTEVYMGLQQKTVEGTSQPYEAIVSAKLYDVQPYIYETNALFQYIVMTMNNDLYQSLPDDVKNIVDESASEACSYGRDLIDEKIDEDKDIITSAGTEILPASQDILDKVKEVSEDYKPTIVDICGEDLVDAFLAPTK